MPDGMTIHERKGAYSHMGKILKKIFKILAITVAALFVVYFWNLDQKLLGWAYKQVNLIFDRKKADIIF